MAKTSVKTREQSALRMPGFNGEASLYTSPARYSSGVSGGTIGAVQPAFECDSEFCRLTMYHGNLYCICHFPP
jgi:hypothetical protein